MEKQARSVEEVRKLESEGYSLTGIVFTLSKDDPVQIPNIDWRNKEGNPGFSWAFVGDREGKVSEENTKFRDMLKAKGSVRVGEYEYKLSKDGHLFSRIKHNEESK